MGVVMETGMCLLIIWATGHREVSVTSERVTCMECYNKADEIVHYPDEKTWLPRTMEVRARVQCVRLEEY